MTNRPDDQLHIRRGKRTDAPALRALSLAGAGPVNDQETSQNLTKQEIQHWRRLASDPALDFYVAELASSLQGVVLVAYRRSLHIPGWRASMDIAVLASPAEEIGQALLSFATERARKRGCKLLDIQACNARGLAIEELLTKNGFSSAGALLLCPLC